MTDSNAPRPRLALVMSGGGARSAYQVGCLAQLAEHFGELDVQVLTGVSAGAINAVFLASHQGDLRERTRALEEMWLALALEDVFRTGVFDLGRRLVGWGGRLSSGGHRTLGGKLRGMVDTTPLWGTLARAFGAEGAQSERVPGIARNIDAGRLTSLGITGSSYSTGQSVTWVQGRDGDGWNRGHRISEPATIGLEHVMASAALPLLFPAVQVHGRWYGDGGIRLTAPLAPAIHLGATHLLTVSTVFEPSPEEELDRCYIDDYPPPAQVAGALLNAVFLDQLEGDTLRLQRINRLVGELPSEHRRGLRPIDLFVIRPGRDLGELANAYEARLPGAFRFLTRGLGTRETRSNDLLSLLMFQQDYLRALMEQGRRDAAKAIEELTTFLAPFRA